MKNLISKETIELEPNCIQHTFRFFNGYSVIFKYPVESVKNPFVENVDFNVGIPIPKQEKYLVAVYDPYYNNISSEISDLVYGTEYILCNVEEMVSILFYVMNKNTQSLHDNRLIEV